MTAIMFRGRQAVQIENEFLRVTVLQEGGHIAEVFDKRAGVNPLWSPPWPSMEPSQFDRDQPACYGTGSEAKLLAGIMGHNLCLDLFGGPSEEETLAGLTVHGEASVNRYEITGSPAELLCQITMPIAQLKFSRSIQLSKEHIKIHETVENLSGVDRPLAWTQHVTLGPPFLDPATTEFRTSMMRSMVMEKDPGVGAYLQPGGEFSWPLAPRKDGLQADLRRMNSSAPASTYTAHLSDPAQDDAYFLAYNQHYRLAFGCVWKRSDFPWLGIWEENCSRPGPPWDGKTVTRGMEFGVSPIPESRKEMVDRHRLLDAPTYKWLSARGQLQAEYWYSSQVKDSIPESLGWPEQSR
jgi:hypothetical protein